MSTLFTDEQKKAVFAIANCLIPSTATMPSLEDADPDFEWCSRALIAHPTVHESLKETLAASLVAHDVDQFLRALYVSDPAAFETLAEFVVGSYVMIPRVKALYGYPGQQQLPAPPDLAAEELSDEVFEGAMSYEGTYRDVGR